MATPYFEWCESVQDTVEPSVFEEAPHDGGLGDRTLQILTPKKRMVTLEAQAVVPGDYDVSAIGIEGATASFTTPIATYTGTIISSGFKRIAGAGATGVGRVQPIVTLWVE